MKINNSLERQQKFGKGFIKCPQLIMLQRLSQNMKA